MSAKQPTVATFVTKLGQMLDNSSLVQYISWTSDGEKFVIHDQDLFSSHVLPMYFKHGNFTSFVRQLHNYDFHKTGTGGLLEFKHVSFVRGRADLRAAVTSKRRKRSNAAAAAAGSATPPPSMHAPAKTTPQAHKAVPDTVVTAPEPMVVEEVTMASLQTENKILRQQVEQLTANQQDLVRRMQVVSYQLQTFVSRNQQMAQQHIDLAGDLSGMANTLSTMDPGLFGNGDVHSTGAASSDAAAAVATIAALPMTGNGQWRQAQQQRESSDMLIRKSDDTVLRELELRLAPATKRRKTVHGEDTMLLSGAMMTADSAVLADQYDDAASPMSDVVPRSPSMLSDTAAELPPSSFLVPDDDLAWPANNGVMSTAAMLDVLVN